MKDTITIQYCDGQSSKLSGKMIADTEYKEIGLREQIWVDTDAGVSYTLSTRKLDRRSLEVFENTKS